MKQLFTKDYYENGRDKHLSLYENFRWMPERSLKEAHYLIKYLNIQHNDIILDYGCAKGFLVKALRILNCEAYGYDISEYAIKNCDPSVKAYVSNNILDRKYTTGFCKDVLEHCEKETIDQNLSMLRKAASTWLIIVPLAKNNKYIIPEYELDKTHRLRFTKNEWVSLFDKHGFKIQKICYKLLGIKDNWEDNKGNLFLFTK